MLTKWEKGQGGEEASVSREERGGEKLVEESN